MKKIYSNTSGIEGSGLYVEEDVKKGEVISIIKGEIKHKVNKNKKDAQDNPDWVGIRKDRWIDPCKPYKFLNHSCNPCAGIKGSVSMVALKNLKSGDEITIDYSTTEADPLWEMPGKCLCGEKNCRESIRSIESLPKKQFTKYLPYVSTYFKNLYLRKLK